MAVSNQTLSASVDAIIGRMATICTGTISAQGAIVAIAEGGKVIVNAGGKLVKGVPVTPIGSLA